MNPSVILLVKSHAKLLHHRPAFFFQNYKWALCNPSVVTDGKIMSVKTDRITDTTRKPEKTNEITDRNIQSVVITNELNSVLKSVGIHRRTIHFVWEDATTW